MDESARDPSREVVSVSISKTFWASCCLDLIKFAAVIDESARDPSRSEVSFSISKTFRASSRARVASESRSPCSS